MSCDTGFFLSVDFLYWYGREDNTSYAIKGQTIQSGTVNDIDRYIFVGNQLEYLGAKWAPGVRVALGWNSDCDGWDTVISWTYYQNTKKGSTSVPNYGIAVYPQVDQFALLNPWGYTNMDEENLTYEKITSKWRLSFNTIDLELGKRYWLSKCFTMRPFTGLRFIWTETDFDLRSTRSAFNDQGGNPMFGNFLTPNNKDEFTNKFWGAGFVTGFQPTWFFTPCFSLFASGDIALLWGEHQMKKTEDYLVTVVNIDGESIGAYDFTNTMRKSDYNSMQAMLDLSIGLRWENYYCSDQYHLEVDLGWEHHVLFDHNTRFQYKDNNNRGDRLNDDDDVFTFSSYNETLHNVSFGGLVLRVRFDF